VVAATINRLATAIRFFGKWGTGRGRDDERVVAWAKSGGRPALSRRSDGHGRVSTATTPLAGGRSVRFGDRNVVIRPGL